MVCTQFILKIHQILLTSCLYKFISEPEPEQTGGGEHALSSGMLLDHYTASLVGPPLLHCYSFFLFFISSSAPAEKLTKCLRVTEIIKHI